jgi:hypothetical protein
MIYSGAYVLLPTRKPSFLSLSPTFRLDWFLGGRSRITSHAHDIYGAWREGAHDDLVLATALACWYGERKGGKTMSITGVLKRSLWKIE